MKKKPPVNVSALVRKAALLREEMRKLEAEYELRAVELKTLDPGVYFGRERTTAIITDYKMEKVDWHAVVRVAKVPARTVARYTRGVPVRKLECFQGIPPC